MVFLHTGHFNFNCWWDFFFLNVEDDDHLSAGFTENGARKGGLNFYRLAFFQKWKVLQSFALPLGQEKAGKCWQTQGRGLAGSAIKQGDQQAHTRNMVKTEMPGELRVREVCRRWVRGAGLWNQDQGTRWGIRPKVRSQKGHRRA